MVLALQTALDMLEPVIIRLPRAFRPVLLGVALLACVVLTFAVRELPPCKCSQRDVDYGEPKYVRALVKRLAYEAYPTWQAAYPRASCPRSLVDLARYAGNVRTVDPWGASYVLVCGDRGIYVASLGEDGNAGTADDIWSHR